MMNFEYKVIPAPIRGAKAKGVKATSDRFALALTEQINEMASEGWDYVRAETLPCEERRGLTGTQITEQNVLVFRRRKESGGEKAEPLTLETGSSRDLPLRREPVLARKTTDTRD